MIRSKEKLIRMTLGVILSLLALNALGEATMEWQGLKMYPRMVGSPFKGYFIPSLILFLVIGGSAIMAAIMVFNNHQYAPKAAFTCGLLVLIWIATQMSIIGYVSWMQPTIVISGKHLKDTFFI